MKAIPTHSLKESLTAYLSVVRLFIKRIEWLCVGGIPLGGLVGMCLARFEQGAGITLNFALLALVVMVLMGLIFYAPIKYWYLPKLYGRTEKELQQLLKQLEDEDAHA